MSSISPLFDSEQWDPVPGFNFQDITYHRARHQGTVRIAFNRPEVRNAFRPGTVDELFTALDHARQWSDVGCVLLTGNGPSPKDGGWAFCSGGDQRIRGSVGYQYETEAPGQIDAAKLGRLHILECQRLIRFMPKVVICVVPGWAVGGGHSLHVVCDMTLASAEHAVFKQTDADVASFDGGFGSAYLARQVGQKRAREIFFLGRNYSAQEAFDMGMVNAVVPHDDLERVALEWAGEVCQSPTAQRMLKFSFNLIDDGLVGQQIFAGEATRLAYMTEEATEAEMPFLKSVPRISAVFPGTTDRTTCRFNVVSARSYCGGIQRVCGKTEGSAVARAVQLRGFPGILGLFQPMMSFDPGRRILRRLIRFQRVNFLIFVRCRRAIFQRLSPLRTLAYTGTGCRTLRP